MQQQQHGPKSETSGISSVVSGLETPEIDLRKQKITTTNISNTDYGMDRPLYKVVEQVNPKSIIGSNTIFGGHSYIIPGLDQFTNINNNNNPGNQGVNQKK